MCCFFSSLQRLDLPFNNSRSITVPVPVFRTKRKCVMKTTRKRCLFDHPTWFSFVKNLQRNSFFFIFHRSAGVCSYYSGIMALIGRPLSCWTRSESQWAYQHDRLRSLSYSGLAIRKWREGCRCSPSLGTGSSPGYGRQEREDGLWPLVAREEAGHEPMTGRERWTERETWLAWSTRLAPRTRPKTHVPLR